ncbi:MAG TPA: 5'/3'-nucleotidase SurE [Solirubrobacterales bacterium]
MRVLVTNDDGIGAEGLHALRRALQGIEGLEVDVIAPHINRSGAARSITTRSPIWVEEIQFDDGHRGFATEGTPVDCVRFADLGLLDSRPDLIVSGINHGSNLGDDVTYSGTVAAAFEGLVLGIPGIAVSQQWAPGHMGYHRAESGFDFRVCARFAAGLVEAVMRTGLPEGMLLNVNCPAEPPKGVEVTRLGKRLYDDELKLVAEDGRGRRRYEIYGFEPSFQDEEGTDLAAVARGRISLTPVHFDLTDRRGMERLREWDLDELLEAASAAVASEAA